MPAAQSTTRPTGQSSNYWIGGDPFTGTGREAAANRDKTYQDMAARYEGDAYQARQQAEAAQGRGGVGVDYGAARQAGADYSVAREGQLGTARDLAAFANQGPGPSAAQAQMQAGQQQALAQNLAMTSGSRGLSGQAQGQQNALNANAQVQSQIAGQSAVLRANEEAAHRAQQMQAMGLTAQTYGNVGGQDLANAQQLAQQQQYAAGLQAEQRRLNDSLALGLGQQALGSQGLGQGYQRMGQQLVTDQANLNARYDENRTGMQRADLDRNQAQQQAEMDAALNTTMSVASLAAQSDERNKYMLSDKNEKDKARAEGAIAALSTINPQAANSARIGKSVHEAESSRVNLQNPGLGDESYAQRQFETYQPGQFQTRPTVARAQRTAPMNMDGQSIGPTGQPVGMQSYYFPPQQPALSDEGSKTRIAQLEDQIAALGGNPKESAGRMPLVFDERDGIFRPELPGGRGEFTRGAPVDPIGHSRQQAVDGLVQQGITDPSTVEDFLNFEEDGRKVGDFTRGEVEARLTASGVGNRGPYGGLPGDAETRRRVVQGGNRVVGAAEIFNRRQTDPDVAGLDAAYEREKNFDPLGSVDLRGVKGEPYVYKDPSVPGAAPGVQWGGTAQQMERTAAAPAVMNTPNGKMVDTGRLALVNTAAISEQQRRMDELEALLGSEERRTRGRR